MIKSHKKLKQFTCNTTINCGLGRDLILRVQTLCEGCVGTFTDIFWDVEQRSSTVYTYLAIGKDSSIVAFKTAAERSRKRGRIAASCGYDYREVQEGEIAKEEERGEQASRGVLVWESDRGGGGDQRGEIHLSMTPRVTSSNTSSCLVSWLNTRLNLMERTRRKEERKRREGVWESGRRKRKNEREEIIKGI